MASPQSTTSHDDSKKNLEQITFRFCSECSNMLYPKEDEDSHRLQFTCRTCQYTEEATSTCVFRNVLNNAAGETAGVTQAVGSDPTVGVPCSSPACDLHRRFPATAAAAGPPPLSIVICMTCGKDVVCSVCGVNPAMAPSLLATSTTTASSISTSTPSTPSDCSTLDELFAHHDVYMPDPDAMMDYEYVWEDGMDKGNGDYSEEY